MRENARAWQRKCLADIETQARDVLFEEANVCPVQSPVIVCGDIHGQFWDLLELFRTGGQLPDTKYIFMGDYVDRGYYSLETLTLLLLYKVKYPDRIVLLRGNHESRQITQVYGFYEECAQKYGNAAVWANCCAVFDLLPLAATIDNRVFCVHGGLSPEITAIGQINLIQRNQEIPQEGLFCDLMWADPEEGVDGWSPSARGAGWLFGERISKEFCHVNNIELTCRAHQLVQDGYKYMFDETLVTVWSAPNYCYRCGNLASILVFDAKMNREFKIFEAVFENEQKIVPERTAPQYFM
jgi:serine/threonine-protein phosphatase 6 catalytic subunit